MPANNNALDISASGIICKEMNEMDEWNQLMFMQYDI